MLGTVNHSVAACWARRSVGTQGRPCCPGKQPGDAWRWDLSAWRVERARRLGLLPQPSTAGSGGGQAPRLLGVLPALLSGGAVKAL